MKQLTKQERDKIIKKINSFMGEGISHCPVKHSRVEENFVYANGEQWSKGDIERQKLKDMPYIPWNGIQKIVNAIANREIVERFVPKVFGRSKTDGGVANILDEACRWQRDIAESEHIESIAVRGMVIGGYGCMHKYWDPTENNGSGKIMDEDVPIWNMLWPSRARQTNLADRRWHICGRWLTIEEANARFGTISRNNSKIMKKLMTKLDSYRTAKASGFDLSGMGDQLDKDIGSAFGAYDWGQIQRGQWVSVASEEMFIIECEWMEQLDSFKVAYPDRFLELESFMLGIEPQIMVDIPDPQTGETQAQPMTMEQFNQLEKPMKDQLIASILDPSTEKDFTTQELSEFEDRYFMLLGREFQDYRKVTRNVIKYAIVHNNELLDYGDRPHGFTYEFLTGFPVETRMGADFKGVVDVAKGPQDYRNALLSSALALYMSSPKRPMLLEEGAVPDMDRFLNEFAKPSGVIKVPAGFVTSGKYVVLDSPSFPPMQEALIQIAQGAIDESFGLSSIEQGTQGDLRRVSGNVVQAAKSAGNTILSILFDSIRRFRKRYGLLNLKMIQVAYSPDQIIRIVGEEKAEDMPIPEQWPSIDLYDIKLDEEPVGVTERIDLMDFLTRTGTLEKWVAAGYLTFEDALEFMPQIPESDKRKIIEKNDTIAGLNSQLEQANAMTALKDREIANFIVFLRGMEGGNDILQQYKYLNNLLEIQKQQEEMQANQQPEGEQT